MEIIETLRSICCSAPVVRDRYFVRCYRCWKPTAVHNIRLVKEDKTAATKFDKKFLRKRVDE